MGTGEHIVGQELERLRGRLRSSTATPSAEELLALAEQLEKRLAALECELRETRQRLKRLADNQKNLDARLIPIEYSRIFRSLRWGGRLLKEWKNRAGQKLLHSPLHGLYLKLFDTEAGDAYRFWLEREAAATPSPEWHQQRAAEFHRRLTVSLLLPVHNPHRDWLEAAIDSVQSQSYPCWELCVCDDASNQQEIADLLVAKAGADPRIRFVRSAEHLGISAALNRAGELARGEYVGFLDQDDLLSPYALHHVVEALQESSPDLIYSDEDQLNSEGQRLAPIFKPAWSPELLTGCMYLGHLLVVSKQGLERVNWFRKEFDGSQDYDLALRLTDGPVSVRHIPHVLYHWRRHAGSTAGDPAAKPYAHAAGRRALEQAVERRGWNARVEDGPLPATYRVRRRVAGQPLVSLVICSRKPKLLARCLRGIQKMTSYPGREIVVVRHGAAQGAALVKPLTSTQCVQIPFEGPFNFSSMNNRGAQAASGEILVFLNDDVEPLVPEWLALLVSQAQRPQVGVVGARLLYPSGAVQHAGIVIGIMDGAGHPHRGTFGSRYWNWLDTARNVSAVTGACLAIRKRVFDELGGFDTAFAVNYNDVDLCLRAREAGFEVLYEPAAALVHREGQTRSPGTRYEERELLYQRWGNKLEQGDPFYNPNLTRVREDASLRLED